jgi:hypothetical protein
MFRLPISGTVVGGPVLKLGPLLLGGTGVVAKAWEFGEYELLGAKGGCNGKSFGLDGWE